MEGSSCDDDKVDNDDSVDVTNGSCTHLHMLNVYYCVINTKYHYNYWLDIELS